MKKNFVLLSITIFITMATMAFAAEGTKPELRPAQKLMQARVVWMTAINKNLDAKNFDAVAKDAGELAGETGKSGAKLPNPLAKELTLAIASLAKDISAAAAKKDGETIKAKLGEIKGKCGECHTRIRDKK